MYVAKKRPLTKAQERAIRAACETDDERLLVCGLLDLGLRLTEWLRLRKRDLRHGTRNSGRSVYYLRVGRSEVEVSPAHAALFISHFYRSPRMPFTERVAEHRLKVIAKRARIKTTITPGVLRNTFSTRLIRSGVGFDDLRRSLRISMETTVRLYEAHVKGKTSRD